MDREADDGHRDCAHDRAGRCFNDSGFYGSQLTQAAAAGNDRKHDRLEKVAAEGTGNQSNKAVSRSDSHARRRRRIGANETGDGLHDQIVVQSVGFAHRYPAIVTSRSDRYYASMAGP